MKSVIKSLIVIAAITAFACSKNESSRLNDLDNSAKAVSETKNLEESEPSSDSPKETGGASGKLAAQKNEDKPIGERKLIKNGDVSFKTKSLSDTKKQIQKTVLAMNGYIAKENVYDYSNNPSEELVVRIPSKDFDQFLNTILMGVDEIDSKHIDIQDVSEEFVDIEARLKNKKQLEAKYQEILSKATRMDDILSIEKEISYIREEIESTEGRLRYLSNQVGYSTLRINYYEQKTSGFNFGGKIGNAFSNGGTGFLWFLIVIVQLWPLWLIGGLIWWFIMWLIKRRRK